MILTIHIQPLLIGVWGFSRPLAAFGRGRVAYSSRNPKFKVDCTWGLGGFPHKESS